jgi:hypothetical protein
MEIAMKIIFNLEYKCLVFNLRKSAQSADEFFYPQIAQIYADKEIMMLNPCAQA